MPFLGREKGRTPKSRRSDDEFVVFLQGIPAHCRWQELKDLVRQTALHIRQAVVYDDSHGFPTGLGQIIIKNEDEAWRTYHRLSTNGWEGQSLVVTLARTSAPTKPIAGPTRSPPAMVHTSFVSGQSTPPRSQDSTTMPPSPISPESVQPTSPTFNYPDYGSMMGSVPIGQQHFMPMMPDPMQCFPPSPMMHCSMYDGPGWGMMPMYPMSPIQPLPEARGDGYHNYHPRKPWTSEPNSKTPTTPPPERAVLIQNLNIASTTADLKSLLRGSGTVEQCNVTITADTRDNQARTHGSAIMQSPEDAKRAVSMLNNLTFMGSRIRVMLDNGPGKFRSGSWDGAMAAEEEAEALNDKSSECSECGKDISSKKSHGPSQPLVVDGSGHQSRSLELLSTSAPT
ncbi:Nucleotide-binding alpha-beta plait [Penicillium cosmopolitanum]|uniref:Nucleotide-binding alpha-beta plait n=1 Tax=Penicillium cosmopolitanum TaxID=1131564 RepID=A0A9W9W5C1_9EURO|nr:Nucleotide-binding alpha-beta plait [Penicillium cosmopolitanum]KAJ5403697.1 Nucleotide-binding alpha-beta plait [Penicillium cosmopolitanum]